MKYVKNQQEFDAALAAGEIQNITAGIIDIIGGSPVITMSGGELSTRGQSAPVVTKVN